MKENKKIDTKITEKLIKKYDTENKVLKKLLKKFKAKNSNITENKKKQD